MRRSFLYLAPLALLLALGLAACGNKGPLVYATPVQDIDDGEGIDDGDEADEADEAGETSTGEAADPDDTDVEDGVPAEPLGDTDPTGAAPPLDPGHG